MTDDQEISGRFGPYARAISVEVAVVAGAHDAADRIAALAHLANENDFVAAQLRRAAGILHRSADELNQAVIQWEAIGARFSALARSSFFRTDPTRVPVNSKPSAARHPADRLGGDRRCSAAGNETRRMPQVIMNVSILAVGTTCPSRHAPPTFGAAPPSPPQPTAGRDNARQVRPTNAAVSGRPPQTAGSRGTE